MRRLLALFLAAIMALNFGCIPAFADPGEDGTPAQISSLNIYDYDDDGETNAYDGVYWGSDPWGTEYLYIVDSALEGEGDLVLPMEVAFSPEDSACDLYPYILDFNMWGVLEDGAVSVNEGGDLVFDKAYLRTHQQVSVALLYEPRGDFDGVYIALYGEGLGYGFELQVLHGGARPYIDETPTEAGPLTAVYDENGDFSPGIFFIEMKYADGETLANDYFWKTLIDAESGDPDVAEVNGFAVTPQARGTAALAYALKADFWSGFSELAFPTSVSVGMEVDAAAAAVIDLIRKLPEADRVSAFDRETVLAARAAYDLLDSEKQGQVVNYDRLTAAEEVLALAVGPLYAMRYTVEKDGTVTEQDVLKPLEGCAEWTFKNFVSTSYSSCILEGAVDDSITAVKVDGQSAVLENGIFRFTLNRPANIGMKLHKTEYFTGLGGVTLAKTVYVISAWDGDRNYLSVRIGGYAGEDFDNLKSVTSGFYDEEGNYIPPKLANEYYDGRISKNGLYMISRYHAAYSLQETFYPYPELNIGSGYSYDYEMFDPYTGVVVSKRMLSAGDSPSKWVTGGAGATLSVGPNLYFIRVWPVSYNGTTYTRVGTAPTVIAYYLDRAAESVSSAVTINSVAASGAVKGGPYEVRQDGNNYVLEVDWNETDAFFTVKVPENVSFKSLSKILIAGSSHSDKAPMTDTVEDGVRTLTFNWYSYDLRTLDFYAEYEVLCTLALQAEDGATQNIYKITLKRPAGPMDGETDADLKSLAVSGNNPLTYQKDGETKTGFDPSVTEYAVALTPNTSSVYVTALSKFISKGAKVTVNGRGTIQKPNNSNSGKSETFPVSAGMEPLVLTIVVTPPAGSAMGTKTYTVTFTKSGASTGDPRITGWKMTTGSHNQLMAPDTTGSGEYVFSATVALSAFNNVGQPINMGMLYMFPEATVKGGVDCNCSKVTLTPTIAMSSCPLVFSYSVNGGDEIPVKGVSPYAFNIPVPNAGLNVIRLFIRDEQGLVTKIHNFEITRDENASLESITSEEAVFVGKFNPTIYRMNMLVEPGTEAVSVTATASQETASMEFNGVTGTGSVTATDLVPDTEYQIKITSGETSVIYYLTIKERQAFSADRVWAVMAAPGQFVNEHSQTVTGTLGAQGWGDGWDTTLYGATPEQAGRSNYGQPGYSLGWFGGFITYEFDEPILNSDTNKYGIDFTVYGNAFYGNAEPAGVEVSEDGVHWYTLAGSKHYEENTVWDYAVTYYNSDPDFDPYVAKDVYWTDNQGGDGYFLATAGYHPQPAYPVGENYCFEGNHANSLYTREQLTLSGTKIVWGPDLFFGYTDVHPNPVSDFDKPGNPYRATNLNSPNAITYKEGGDYGDGFDISWAVDEDGYPVNLQSVKYVKVYTAVSDYNVGEVSPEILAITRTTGESASVGQTGAPAVTVNGKALALTEGVYEYDVEVDGAVEIRAELPGANVWVNNNQFGSFEDDSVKDGRIVRIIAQEGEHEPTIYYLTLQSGEAPEITEVQVDPTAPTTGKVTVTVVATDDTGVEAYSFDGGDTWQTENNKEYTENTTIPAGDIQAKDAAGNVTVWPDPVVIDNIEPIEGYQVSLMQDQTVAVGDTANVMVTVASGDKEAFNAVDITLGYDADKLEYLSLSDEENYDADTEEPGKVHITGYGPDKALGAAFTVQFTAKSLTAGTDVTIESAKIDESANAIDKDAPEAALGADTAVITVGGYRVTLGEYLSGDPAATPGEDYTFSAVDPEHYDYALTVTVDGADVTDDVIDNGDGTYTVPGEDVTGILVITATRTAKTYSVTVSGSGAGDVSGAAATAAYGTSYTFTLTKEEDYGYEVTMKIGGAAYTGFGVSGDIYTIPGADITGDIVITVTKTELPSKYVTVTFEGTGAGDATGAAAARKGDDYTFNVAKAEGYLYTVTAKVGGAAVTLTEGQNGNYTIEGADITANIVITIEKTLAVSVSVHEYVKLDGKSVFLVLASGTPGEGKIYAYDGNAMFRSEEYGAYAYLVVSDTALNAETAKEKITAPTGAATAISYTGDVNGSGRTDINDAQLVYDIYNAKYEGFGLVSTMKFLRADMNRDFAVDARDAAAVIAILMG